MHAVNVKKNGNSVTKCQQEDWGLQRFTLQTGYEYTICSGKQSNTVKGDRSEDGRKTLHIHLHDCTPIATCIVVQVDSTKPLSQIE